MSRCSHGHVQSHARRSWTTCASWLSACDPTSLIKATTGSGCHESGVRAQRDSAEHGRGKTEAIVALRREGSQRARQMMFENADTGPSRDDRTNVAQACSHTRLLHLAATWWGASAHQLKLLNGTFTGQEDPEPVQTIFHRTHTRALFFSLRNSHVTARVAQGPTG